MYLDFYQLQHDPFPSTPEPAYLFLSPSHQQALATLTSGVAERHGLVLITGARGVGKTTILHAYLAQEHPAQRTTLVSANAQVTFPALLTTLCQAGALEATSQELCTVPTQFHQFLLAEYRHGRNLALLIDDAHRLPLATLEQLRRLANLDIAPAKLVQIVLVGQPELEPRLHRYALRHSAPRPAMRATLVPLTKAESYAYIRACLAHVARPGRPVFTHGALTCLVRAAHGIPQRLNSLCTQALVRGCDRRQHPITAPLARAVIAECTGVTPAPRWPLGLATAAGLCLVTGGLWLALHAPLRRTIVPESAQPLAPAGPLAPRHTPAPLAGPPSLWSPPVSAAGPAPGPSEPPTPLPSGSPASAPPLEVRRDAESSPSAGEATSPSAATQEAEHPAAPIAGATEVQAFPPERGETTAARLPRTVRIKRGDSVWKLALGTYGFVDAHLLRHIQAQNPHLKNLDVIPRDATLVLPELEPQGAQGQ